MARPASRLYTIGKRDWTITQLAKKRGMSYATLYARLVKFGWDLETALKTPVRPKAS